MQSPAILAAIAQPVLFLPSIAFSTGKPVCEKSASAPSNLIAALLASLPASGTSISTSLNTKLPWSVRPGPPCRRYRRE